MKRFIEFSFCLLALTVLTACPAQEEEQDTDVTALAATLDSLELDVQGEGDEGESRSRRPRLRRLLPFFKFFAPIRRAKECIDANWDPALGSESCEGSVEDRTAVSEFQDCESGRSRYSAKVVRTFDEAQTCAVWVSEQTPESGEVSIELPYFERTHRRGRLSISSDSHQNYLGESIGGGMHITYGEFGKEVVVNGFHKVGNSRRRRGKRIDQSIRSVEALQTEVGEGVAKVISGTVVVDHNLAQFSSTSTMSDLSWSESCCYPVSGKVDVAFSGSKQGELSVSFVTDECGAIEVQKDGGEIMTHQLPTCR